MVPEVVVVVILAAVAAVDETVGIVQFPLNLFVVIALRLAILGGGGSSHVEIDADDVRFTAG
jgi:hypothetical protein